MQAHKHDLPIICRMYELRTKVTSKRGIYMKRERERERSLQAMRACGVTPPRVVLSFRL